MSYRSYRPGGNRWFRVGSVDIDTSTLVAGLAAISLVVEAVAPGSLFSLALVRDSVTSGQVWRLLTWPFLNQPNPNGFSIVIGIVVVWYFGRALESNVGRNRYLWMMLSFIGIPALLGLVYGIAVGDQLGIASVLFLSDSVIVAYLAAHPGARTFFDIPFWILVAVLLAINALQFLQARAWAYFVFLGFSIIVGLLASRAFGISRLTWIPRIPLPSTMAFRQRSESRKRKRASHLQVVRGNDLDMLLDKVAQSGLSSLTADERRRLDEHSRRSRES